jgi:hypothetical protein
MYTRDSIQLTLDENMTISHIREAILPSPILAYLHITPKGTVSCDEYFSEGLNILISISVYALVVFKVFQKLFTTTHNFICFFEIPY